MVCPARLCLPYPQRCQRARDLNQRGRLRRARRQQVYESGYCSRADSMHAFKEMNFELPRHKGHAVPWSDRPSFPDKTDEEKKVR